MSTTSLQLSFSPPRWWRAYFRWLVFWHWLGFRVDAKAAGAFIARHSTLKVQ
jgi:hypothetical protein